MTDTESLELQIRNLERELREARETLVDKFALAIAAEVFSQWSDEGMTYDLNKRVWSIAKTIAAARSVK